jgi:hypothetical protein
LWKSQCGTQVKVRAIQLVLTCFGGEAARRQRKSLAPAAELPHGADKQESLVAKRQVMPEVFYSGDHLSQVTVREGERRRPLDPRFDLCEHSPSGVGWTKDDGGPIQLSLALLADALGDDARALRLQHSFCERVATILPDRWTISRTRIVAYANMIDYDALIGDGDLREARLNHRLYGADGIESKVDEESVRSDRDPARNLQGTDSEAVYSLAYKLAKHPQRHP